MQLKLKDKYDATLLEKAKELGYLWGENPSVTAMVEAIATAELALTKAKQVESANYSELKRLINSKQSFKLVYRDVAGEPFVFSCTYAEIKEQEGKPYLNIWFTEDLESDCPDLRHNRCLRVDRIIDSVELFPLNLPWRESGLDSIEITFELYGKLCFAYHKDDLDTIEPLGENRIRVTSKITNLFWFRRKIIRYAPDLKIISPTFVASWYQSLLEKALEIQSSEL